MGIVIKVVDEETALQAQNLAEQGHAVSYSDRWRFVSRVVDPEKLSRLLKHSLEEACFPIEVEVVK